MQTGFIWRTHAPSRAGCGASPQRTLPRIIAWLWIAVFFFIPPAMIVGEPEAARKLQVIDLPSALRLAGAQNLDVQLAREKLAEARAAQETAIDQFFPSVFPGITNHR